ncbi:MAG: type I-E CRISPR-associated protein Cse1/CasA [Oscillospiraceae bacterium]|nr:type I-E CRISPR-associated protein Cse1/CasA [Oscillospiraceae bacterium]
MTEPIYNLLDEPWVKVTNLQGEEEMLSITSTLVKSHELRSLSGEMPSQDLAILRLLLGVLYSIYTRTEEYENARDDESKDACMDMWERLWKRSHFLENEIVDYLQKYRDRFWLRHPELPFYQLAEIKKGSDFVTSKMIGSMVESSNKTMLFQSRTGKSKQYLDYPEATRWLLYLNSFDDASAKPSQKGLESMSVAWLGQLGLVYVAGANLFETLMLNFSLVNFNIGEGEPWGKGDATWELEKPRTAERTVITVPSSAEELFTLQSRRIQLKYQGDKVTGFTLLGGDKFDSEDAFAEPMTTWKLSKSKTGSGEVFIPPSNAARNPSKQLWRDFAPLLLEAESDSEKHRKPGVLKWISELDGIISSKQVQICTMSIKYGNMQSGIDEVWDDTLSVNTFILSKVGEKWIGRITNIVKTTEDLVKTLGNLASNIAKASGSVDGLNQRNYAMERAYAALDIPFRTWLASIDDTSNINEKCNKWIDKAKRVILDHGENLVSQAGTQAFVGRTVIVGNKESHYSTPRVYGWFKGGISKILSNKIQ